jgi:hypothetical protein
MLTPRPGLEQKLAAVRRKVNIKTTGLDRRLFVDFAERTGLLKPESLYRIDDAALLKQPGPLGPNGCPLFFMLYGQLRGLGQFFIAANPDYQLDHICVVSAALLPIAFAGGPSGWAREREQRSLAVSEAMREFNSQMDVWWRALEKWEPPLEES